VIYDTFTGIARFDAGGIKVLIRSNKMNTRGFMWFEPPEPNTLRPREMYCRVCGAVQNRVELVRFCRLPGPFIAQVRAATLRPGA
jgi:hypothetical protein